MTKIDKLVCAPHFYTMEGEGVGYRANAAMAVDCGKILEVGPRDDLFSRYLPEEVIELKHHMVLPGFIDGICTPPATSCVVWLRIPTAG